VRVILDTNILLHALIEPTRLGAETAAILEAPEHEVFFSAASIWEISIKAALGRADFKVSPAEIVLAAVGSGFLELPVRSAAAARVASLPPLHRDLFDELRVAQAMTEPALLYTTAAALKTYSELAVCV
jgi:PIN domain nuclease of toxin-antitoxin system